MAQTGYPEKGASLGPGPPWLQADHQILRYGQVQAQSDQIARALPAAGPQAGYKVPILSASDPVAFSCVFGISGAGAVWCPINPRNEAAENRFILDGFDCSLLLFPSRFAAMV